ncbi:hypothetical protein [Mycobacterium sp. 141]|uniref:hypothetical protein n=1 Tax=Mycobacterium sp. 141 TaxID=1120797 RepID=UPI0003A2EAAE|nr:hypothetical protein [Mycobacterium sp. 141]
MTDNDFDLDDEFDPDLEGRVSAALRAGAVKSGIPWQPFTDAQKREANAYAEAMAAVAAIHICGALDKNGDYCELKVFDTHDQANPATGKLVPQGDMILQMLAADRFKQYQKDCSVEDELLLDVRRSPGYIESDPLTATRLYVLTYRTKHAVALETPYDWQGYLGEALGSLYKCDVHLLDRCYDHQATPALMTLVYKRGEYVFAWKVCDECLDALSWVRYGHPNYAGPLHKWIDKGKRVPRVEW